MKRSSKQRPMQEESDKEHFKMQRLSFWNDDENLLCFRDEADYFISAESKMFSTSITRTKKKDKNSKTDKVYG